MFSVFQTLGFRKEAEEEAIVELQAAGLLPPGDLEGELEPTDEGWATIEKIWPAGQLPVPGHGRLTCVIGSFDSVHDLPVRLAYAVRDIEDVVDWGTPFRREMSDQKLVCRAWQLLWPPTGVPEDLLLVRVDGGHGKVAEQPSSGAGEIKISVGEGTWLSVDREGRVREVRRELEEIVFLIAMHAA